MQGSVFGEDKNLLSDEKVEHGDWVMRFILMFRFCTSSATYSPGLQILHAIHEIFYLSGSQQDIEKLSLTKASINQHQYVENTVPTLFGFPVPNTSAVLRLPMSIRK